MRITSVVKAKIARTALASAISALCKTFKCKLYGKLIDNIKIT